jgi:hypothetical protein
MNYKNISTDTLVSMIPGLCRTYRFAHQDETLHKLVSIIAALDERGFYKGAII